MKKVLGVFYHHSDGFWMRNKSYVHKCNYSVKLFEGHFNHICIFTLISQYKPVISTQVYDLSYRRPQLNPHIPTRCRQRKNVNYILKSINLGKVTQYNKTKRSILALDNLCTMYINTITSIHNYLHWDGKKTAQYTSLWTCSKGQIGTVN